MTPYNFDTGNAIESLRSGGFDDEQSSALIAIIVESQQELATKADLELMAERLNASFGNLETQFADFKAEIT